MKWGIRKPSLRKRLAARTSVPRFVRHSLGFKAPRGYGWLTNPRSEFFLFSKRVTQCVCDANDFAFVSCEENPYLPATAVKHPSAICGRERLSAPLPGRCGT